MIRNAITSLARTLTGMTILTLCMVAPASAAPAGPFGNALPDEGGFGVLAWFPKLLGPFIAAQIAFQRQLTTAIHAVARDPHALWGLMSLSFVYGVLHAIGPGHGKAVVTSYVLATRQTLRNGVILAFLSSVSQAVCAILLALAAAFLFHMTSVGIAQATVRLEMLADAAILLLGVRLLWLKALRPLLRLQQARARLPAAAVAGAGGVALPVSTRFAAMAADEEPAADHAPDCDCGRLHMPTAAQASGPLDWSKVWMVIVTTGLRPCSGALIVLAFALSQRVLPQGIAATAVMGLGTFVTVATLAALAVGSRSGAFAFVRERGPLGPRLARILEALAAVAVFLFGLSLTAGHLLATHGWSS
jgi:ABC-type nickel/cobalt efflux system permease component RcnA